MKLSTDNASGVPDPIHPDTSAQGCEGDWHEHEHTCPNIQFQAEQLLDTAGSPELAKHAIDVAASQLSMDAADV